MLALKWFSIHPARFINLRHKSNEKAFPTSMKCIKLYFSEVIINLNYNSKEHIRLSYTILSIQIFFYMQPDRKWFSCRVPTPWRVKLGGDEEGGRKTLRDSVICKPFSNLQAWNKQKRHSYCLGRWHCNNSNFQNDEEFGQEKIYSEHHEYGVTK